MDSKEENVGNDDTKLDDLYIPNSAESYVSDIDESSFVTATTQDLSTDKGFILIKKILPVLGVAFVASLIYSMGIIPIPFGIGFAPPPVVLENGDIPCLPKENIAPVAFNKIEVNVLNSTNRSGLAKNTAEVLKKLGMKVNLVSNTDKKFANAVTIMTGKENIVKAYTVSNLFSSSIITYRKNIRNIEIILGEGFSEIIDDKEKFSKPLVSLHPCKSEE